MDHGDTENTEKRRKGECKRATTDRTDHTDRSDQADQSDRTDRERHALKNEAGRRSHARAGEGGWGCRLRVAGDAKTA